MAVTERTNKTMSRSRHLGRRDDTMNAAVRPAAMKVPLLDLKPQYQALKAEIDAAIAACARASISSWGRRSRSSRRRVADYSQCEATASASLRAPTRCCIALMALDIGAGR